MRPELTRSLLLAAALTVLSGCSWRDDDPYFRPFLDADVESWDADACDDADVAECPGDAESCEDADQVCRPREASWIDHGELYTLIASEDPTVVVVDVRPVGRCEIARIPTSQCIPWDGERLAASLDVDDLPGWLALYDENGETLADVATTLPSFCARTVVMLRDGFGAWQAAGFELEMD